MVSTEYPTGNPFKIQQELAHQVAGSCFVLAVEVEVTGSGTTRCHAGGPTVFSVISRIILWSIKSLQWYSSPKTVMISRVGDDRIGLFLCCGSFVLQLD